MRSLQSRFSFGLRCLWLGGLLVLLWLAHFVIRDVVDDRIRYRTEARASVMQSYPGSQIVAGPVIGITYEEKYFIEVEENPGVDAQGVALKPKFPKLVKKAVNKFHTHYILPDELNIANQMKTEPRYRGIFKVNTFNSQMVLQGKWIVPKLSALPHTEPNSTLVLPTSAQIFVAVQDARGLSAITAQIGSIPTAPNPNIARIGDLPSVLFDLPLQPEMVDKSSDLPFSIQFNLAGTDSIQYVPLARENAITVASDWPHPSFEGAALPNNRQAKSQGFNAEWKVSSVSSEARGLWLHQLNSSSKASAEPLEAQEAIVQSATHAVARASSYAVSGRPVDHSIRGSGLGSFGVRLIDPVDIYSMSDRATKYAMLFVLLTLGSFVLFELFKKLRIHPVQYLMVGVALLLFFLLLVSLAEQVGFNKAYALASLACSGLIGFYASHLLQSWKRALPLTLGLVVLYGSLHQILISEDKALVMGSILLFVILATLMIGTRKTNWYALTQKSVD